MFILIKRIVLDMMMKYFEIIKLNNKIRVKDLFLKVLKVVNCKGKNLIL